MQEDVGLIDTAQQATAALHPLRSQLLEQFREASSAAEAARRMELPRQRIGHHVRLLQEHGLIAEVGTRRRGALTERLLQTTARAWVISPTALGAAGVPVEQLRDEFSSAYLAAASAKTLRELGELRRMADEQNKRVATMTLETEIRFRNPAEQAEFADQLRRALADLVERFHDDHAAGGRRFRFMIGGHPAVEASQGENDVDSSHH